MVHDYLKEYGGAERVLEALHEIWPQAPIYTLVYLPQHLGPHQERLKSWEIRPIIPRWLPLTAKLISPLRLLAPLLFRRLNLTDYDLVIVSATGAYTPNLIKTKRGAHLCYCHTPPRYLYGLPTAREWRKHWWVKIPAEIANHFLRLVDFLSAQKVDFFIANSKNTAARIKKFYRQEAKVIYPPVEINHQPSIINHQSSAYFLTGGRLARPKRIDLVVAACTELALPLKVFGRLFAGYGKELRRMAGPTIEFLGEVSDQELAQLYAGCQAFIFSAEEEDFGLVPVEAMNYGKPVIALRSGGVVESVIAPSSARVAKGEAATGIFFDEPTVESLIKALKRFKSLKFRPEACRRQAKKFSKEKFKKEIKKFVEKRCRSCQK